MNREDEITLLLGMAIGALSQFKSQFNTHQEECYERILKQIDILFYSKPLKNEVLSR